MRQASIGLVRTTVYGLCLALGASCATAVAEWCTADSFLPSADKARWTAVYKALEAEPDAAAVTVRLAPNLEGIVQYLANQGASTRSRT